MMTNSYRSHRKKGTTASYDLIKYTVEHGMGSKWSLYLAEIFAAEFKEINHEAEFEKLDNALAFMVNISKTSSQKRT